MKKESDRSKKQKCAIKIQKLWKGYVQRKDFRVLIDYLRNVKKLRKILEKHHNQYKS